MLDGVLAEAAGAPSGVADVLAETLAESERRWRDRKEWLAALATVLTNGGRAVSTARLAATTQTPPIYIGWGTGTVTATITDTALGTERGPTTSGGRSIGTPSQVTITASNDTYQVVGTVTATASFAITEAATFDATTSGTMFIRGDFSAVNVASGDSIVFTFKLQFT